MLVGAQLQQIVYRYNIYSPKTLLSLGREYLPVVLGAVGLSAMPELTEVDTTYKPFIDPSILNEFATVAYR